MRLLMSVVAFLFAFLIVAGMTQPCVAAGIKIEPCYAKNMTKRYAMPPETEIRREVAQVVNLRPGCHAFLTGKRSLENYLHSAAIYEARGETKKLHDLCEDAQTAPGLNPLVKAMLRNKLEELKTRGKS